MRKVWDLGFARRHQRVPGASASTEAAADEALLAAQIEDTAEAVAEQAGPACDASAIAAEGYAALREQQITVATARKRGKFNGK